MYPQLNDRDGLLLARSYDLNRYDVAADALVIETWRQPADDLVSWLSRRHGWRADVSVSYLTAIKQVCGSPTAATPVEAALAIG
jgi:hypothetical protein